MTTSRFGEREFVSYLFVPLDGPNAAIARRQLELLWEACRTELGMTHAIDGAGLSTSLPSEPGAGPDGALAGMEDRDAGFQAVLRREGDTLSFALLMAPRWTRLGATIPPGWAEFDRWWERLTAGGTSAFLGGATVFQARGRVDVRAELPPRDDDADEWQTGWTGVPGLGLWEVTDGRDRAFRRLVVSGTVGRFTWRTDDGALPPLGRYLAAAAGLRYRVRMIGDGSGIRELLERTTARLKRLPALPLPGNREMAGLAVDLAQLSGTRRDLDEIRAASEPKERMHAVLPTLLFSDMTLVVHLSIGGLSIVHMKLALLERQAAAALRMGPLLRERHQQPPPTSILVPLPPEPAPPRRTETRVGFVIDVAGFGDLPTAGRDTVRQRLAGLIEKVLTGAGVALADTDRWDSRSGLTVLLPAGFRPPQVVPRLLEGWRTQLAADSAAHPTDGLRLLLSVTAGPIATTEIGFAGAVGTELERLLDGAADHPGDGPVVLISERVHQDVADPGDYTRIIAHGCPAWLWRGSATARQTRVFVIDCGDERARIAVFGLLRALDLRPLEWEELVARTGSAAPERGAVLRQAFAEHTAAVVVFAPGGSSDLRAGMAMALHPERTILVRLGTARLPDDLAGRETVNLNSASVAGVHQLAERLRRLGYAVGTDGTDWLDLDRFKGF